MAYGFQVGRGDQYVDDGDYYGGTSDISTDDGSGKLGLSFLAIGILALMTYYVVTRGKGG